MASLDPLQLSAVAASTPDYRRAHLWSLVLMAVAVPHDLARQEDRWQLLVGEADRQRAQREIAAYEDENRNWPPPRLPIKGVGDETRSWSWVTLLGIGLLAVFHGETGPWRAGSLWFGQGAVEYEAVVGSGQWWRLLTALTLHADIVHLMGNMIIGGLLVYLFCRELGDAMAWSLLLVGGMLANGVNCLLHQAGYHSVGFSTAVFVAVGGLCGLQGYGRARMRELLLPLGAGGGLLALLGSSGAQTDLGAHFWGWVVGFLLVSGLLRLPFYPSLRRRWQAPWLLLLPAALLVGGWLLAMG